MTPNKHTEDAPQRELHVSFVVDHAAQYPFYADLLLASLLANTSIPAGCVVAQFVEGAHPGFRRSLEARGVQTATIHRFLDGTYCNKLQQLRYFAQRNADVMVVDTDVFFAADPRELIPDRDAVSGKPVDHANPGLDSLRAIWDAAGLDQPELVWSDADVRGGLTFPANFNGGFYYVPGALAADLDERWRRWGEWLYARRAELLSAPDQIFVEQVAFALAVAEGGHRCVASPTNLNYPIILPEQPRLFRPDLPVVMLHHHGLLPLTQLRPLGHVNEPASAALREAQRAIDELDSSYRAMNNAAFQGPIEEVDLGADLLAALSEPGAPQRLALHVGTCKSGTSAIQEGFMAHREELLQAGLDYPDDTDPEHPVRHQWLVTHLLTEDIDQLESRLATLWRGSRAPRVLLSTEGLSNHWADFSPRMKGWLRALAHTIETDVYLYLRPQADYLRSLHAQAMRNLPHPRFPYGVKDSVSVWADRLWVTHHLDYLGLVESMRQVYGRDRVHVRAYRRDIVPDFLLRLGLASDLLPAGDRHVNASISPLAVYVGRKVVRIPGSLEFRMEITKRALRLADRVADRTGWTGPPDPISPRWLRILDHERRLAEKEFSIKF